MYNHYNLKSKALGVNRIRDEIYEIIAEIKNRYRNQYNSIFENKDKIIIDDSFADLSMIMWEELSIANLYEYLLKNVFIEEEVLSNPVPLEDILETNLELEKTAHKIVLLHELGVIGHLQKLREQKNSTLSDTKFAELIGLILGLQGKKIEAVRKGISGYGQGTKDDPKTPTALQKVRSELLKFGIEL